jgi:hypothetical protein
VLKHSARQAFFIGLNVYILIGFDLYLVMNVPKDFDAISYALQTTSFVFFLLELAVRPSALRPTTGALVF